MAASGEMLVGRGPELERIDAALEALDGGIPGCLAIEGEPGIGKSRLLAELRRRAEQRGHIVLRGQAAEFERDRPFGVLVETLDPYLEAQLDDGLAGASARLRDELGQVFPALGGNGDGPAPLGEERYRSHRAVRSLLELLAERKPLVIALDDLHWGDDATIELLGALLRRPPEAAVLVIPAYRPGSAPPTLTAALAVPLVSRLELDRLSEAEAADLLGDLDAGALAAIYRHGGGNPFYLQQLARLDQPQRLDDDAAADPGDVPAGVTASLASEIALLSPQASALLDAASVAGEPFDPGIAADVAALEEAVALSALDELLERDLVRPTEVPRRFIFRHPLVRRSVYESIGGGSRLAAHARAAAGLAARGAPAAERAHHVEQAAGPGDAAAVGGLLGAGGAAPRPPSAPTTSSRRRARATRRRSRSCSRRPRRRAAGPRRWRRAGWTERCGCWATATASARSRSGSRWRRPCARSASWSAVARCCWRRSSSWARTTSRGGWS